MDSGMRFFLWGALSMGSAIVALCFLRYWSRSRDRLFGYFAGAFAALGLNWIGLAVANPGVESRHMLYLLRLLAFVLIIVGILDKNERSKRAGDGAA